MSNNQIVQVRLDGSTGVYSFKNAHEFNIKVGDKVACKVGTGGTTTGIVVGFGEPVKEMTYKNIVEVYGIKKEQESLQEGNKYVCDIRIWRNQWSSNGGYAYQWSDLVKTCLYDESENIGVGSIVIYEDTEGKVVNLRQVPVKKTLKMTKVHLKPMKKGFFARLFNK